MKADWLATPFTNFVADLEITGIDSGIGVIERLSRNITELGLNIRSMSISGNEGYFKGKVSLIVGHTDQLTIAIRGLKTIEGVSSVIRLV